ncbi:hypothetical protein NQZ68_039163 [Dissostichus eleginoides]|nr:hypothetical protein NQZ68_039163 [Dissostichus eleginoides]
MAHLRDRGPRLCKITVTHGAEGSPAAAGVFTQTTEREMDPCVTPNTTNTMSEGGEGWLKHTQRGESSRCYPRIKHFKWALGLPSGLMFYQRCGPLPWLSDTQDELSSVSVGLCVGRGLLNLRNSFIPPFTCRLTPALRDSPVVNGTGDLSLRRCQTQ